MDVNECASHPCAYGATCIDRVGAYECICPERQYGQHCEEVIIETEPKPPAYVNECASHPCAYDATCIDRVGAYECICPERRYGQHCEEVIIETEPKPPACNFYS
ncbi:unnamed protein product [Trichobilharzia szidati]|nr:unnamed protein product [Trichobilharzia szidati]